MTLQPLYSLNNFTGTFCSIIGKKHLIAFYDDSPILINLYQGFHTKCPLEPHGQYKDDFCKNPQDLELFLRMSYFVWLNGIPILLDKIEEGMKLKFDAILIPKVGYQAILMWTGTKPQSLPILKANELLLIQEYFNIPVHCITFENGVPNVYVYLDGCVVKIPISYKNVTINDDELKSNEEIRKVCSIIHPSNSVAKISKLASANLPGKYLYICNQIDLGKSKLENVYESKLQFRQVYKTNLLYELIVNENSMRIYFDIKLELNFINNEYFLCFNVNDNNVKLKYSDLLNFELKEKSAAGKGHLVYVKNDSGTCFWHAIIFEMIVNNHDTIKIGNFPSLITLEQDYVSNCHISDISVDDKRNIGLSFEYDDVEKFKGKENFAYKYSEFERDRAIANGNLNSISNASEVSGHYKIKVCESTVVPVNNSINQQLHESISIIDDNALSCVSNKFMFEIETDRTTSKASAAIENYGKKSVELNKFTGKAPTEGHACSSVTLNKINQSVRNGIFDRKFKSSTINVTLTEFCKEMHGQNKQVLEAEEFYSFEKYFLTNDISLEDLYLSVEKFSGNNILIIEKHLIQILLEEIDAFPQYIRYIYGKFFFNNDLKINFIVSKLNGHWIIIFTNSVTMYFYKEILFRSENGLIKNGTDVFFDAAFHNGNIGYVALVVYDCTPPNTALSCLDHYYYFNMEGIYKGEGNGCVLVDLFGNDSSGDIFTIHLQIKNKEDVIFFQRLQIKKDLKILIYIMEVISTCEFKILFFSPSEAAILSLKSVENNVQNNNMQCQLYDKFTTGHVYRNLKHIQNEDPYLLSDHIAIVSKVDFNVTLSITFPNGVKLLQNISKDHLVYNNKSWVCANTLSATTVVHFDGIVSSEVIGLFLLIWVSVRPDEKSSTYCTKYFGLPGLISSTNKNSVDINIVGISSKLPLFNFVVPVDKNTMIFDHRGVAYKKKLKANEVVLIYLNKYSFHNYRKNVCLIIVLLSSSMAKQYLPLLKKDEHLGKDGSVVMKDSLCVKLGIGRPSLEIDSLHKRDDSSNKASVTSKFVNDKSVASSEPCIDTAISNNYETATSNDIKIVLWPEMKDKYMDINVYYYNCSIIFDASRFAILTAAKKNILLCKDDMCYSTANTLNSSMKLLNTKAYVNAFVVFLQKPIKFGTLIFTHRALVAWQGPKSSIADNVNSLFISRHSTYTENSVREEALLGDEILRSHVMKIYGATSSVDSLSKKCPTPGIEPELSLLNNHIVSNESGKNEKGTIPKFVSSKLNRISTQSDCSKIVISKDKKDKEVVKIPHHAKKDNSKFFLNCKLIFIGSHFAILASLQNHIILLKIFFCNSLKLTSLSYNHDVNAFVVFLQKPIKVGQMSFTHRALVAWHGSKDSTLENVDSLFYSRSLSYSEELLPEKDLFCDAMLMNFILNKPASENFSNNILKLTKSEAKPNFIPIKDTKALPNVVTSSTCNKLKGFYVPNIRIFKLMQGDLKINFYNITGKVIVVSGNEGIIEMTNQSDSKTIYFYFQKKVCFIDGRKMANTADSEFTKVLTEMKDFFVSINAEVYECKKEKLFGFEFCYSVAILWNGKKPQNEKYLLLKEPLCNSKDIHCQQASSKSNSTKNKAQSSLELSSLSKQISPAKKGKNKSKSLPTSNKTPKKVKDNINNVKSKKNSTTCLLSSMPIPIAPVTRRKAIDSKCEQNNKNLYLVGMLKAVDEAFGEVETPNKVLYPFTRERCFLYGLSLYNLPLKDIVKIGCIVEFEIDEYKSVNELWIGIPQINEELKYSCVLQWCKQNSVPSTVKLKLLAAIDWIPADCDPLIKADSAFEIVTL